MNIKAILTFWSGVLTLTTTVVFAHPELPKFDGKPAAKAAEEKPPEMEGATITEKLGAQLDLDLTFKNEEGVDVPLKSYFKGHLPVVLSFVYFSCPGLCSFHLDGLYTALKEVPWNPGEKFEQVVISFDPKDTSEIGKAKKENYLKKVYERPQVSGGVHYLTGSEENIKKLTSIVGFGYKWNEKEKEWAHSSAAVILTATGVISRYLPGVIFEPKTVKMALNEAADGKIGTLTDKLFLFCYQYDPHQSKYTLMAFRLVQMGGGLMVLVLALFLLPAWWRARRENAVVAK